MKVVNRCPNMNHGRSNPTIRFCPNCGESINRRATGRCDHNKHAELRKQRHTFCYDCGKSLSLV
jgi:hypothetical protein